MKKLAGRRIRENAVVSQEFARVLCELSFEMGRQIGTLVDRQGRVRHVIVGDKSRIYIPELERNRSVRLRGLRLLHTHIYNEPLSHEDLADLTLLRLDYITAITIDEGGFPRNFFSAHVLPGQNPGYEIEPARAPGQLSQNFQEKIQELETYFENERNALLAASKRPRAILVGVYTPKMRVRRRPEDSMLELRELCRTAGVEICDEIIQNRGQIDPLTVVGSGKIKEISIRAVQENAELMIFDLELSPSQASRLSLICDLKIIDRTQLILDIFSRNARSRDGKLQVELAQLRYLKERLSEKDDNMSRLTGGIGGRGPGETKLEIGRRRVDEKIARLERELKGLRRRRELNRTRRARNKLPIVSIVGYTNAGKSTLLNSLTESEVFTEDRLFATLDSTTRRLRFPREKEIILSDTVGFIHDLPPELRRAFQATLEELENSDLLLHCIDISDPLREQKQEAVHLIICELNLLDIPCIRVFNKCDLLQPEEIPSTGNDPMTVCVSAANRSHLDELLGKIEAILFYHRRYESSLHGQSHESRST